MKILFILMFTMFSFHAAASECPALLDHEVRQLNDKKTVRLCDAYRGKVVLIVNTASKCAYTDQYESLEKMYSDNRDKGLVVLGFPSNDFGAQEPGTEKQIKSFCRLTYGVEFPMFSKTRVTARNADPVFRQLAEVSGRYPQWNFHKYLIGRDGEFVADYPSSYDPLGDVIYTAVKNELEK